jgi:amyloid beta precursor protein binding protein 1
VTDSADTLDHTTPTNMATNNKYDRQLRLWGAAGQAALGDTCVVLVRATAAGCETLKNLILPGVGAFCVVDDAPSVTPEDVAANFFLTRVTSDRPTPTRAAVAMELLQELNPDVEASHVHLDPASGGLSTADWSEVLSKVLQMQQRKDGITTPRRLLLIASDCEPPLWQALATYCAAPAQGSALSLIAVQSYGLLGTVRLQMPPQPVTNPKPRSTRPDLRLVRPFPALAAAAAAVDWEGLDRRDHGHVPFPLLLLHVAAQYKAANGGNLPRSLTEKQAFQQAVKAAARDYPNQLNFQEGVASAFLAYTESTVDFDHLRDLLVRAQAAHLTKFAALLTALLAFLDRHDGQAPLHGSIPDMTASTEGYMALQTLYRQQAAQDLQDFTSLLTMPVPPEEVTTFCQNVTHLDLVTPRSWAQETASLPDDETKEDLVMAVLEAAGDEENEQGVTMLPVLWYLGLRACQVFYMAQGRYPGVLSTEEEGPQALQKDAAVVQTYWLDLVRVYGLDQVFDAASLAPSLAQEVVRYGAAEVHTIASVVGGVASQEAVKLITGQYVPLNHTYIYNGIASTAGVYRF